MDESIFELNGSDPSPSPETPSAGGDNPPAPVVEPVVEQVVKDTPPTETPPADPELFELPDGRKVDALTLSKEWKENFLPEFTRKSQLLSDLKPKVEPSTPTQWKDENWQPKSYGELIELAKAEVFGSLEAQNQQKIEQSKAVEDAVNGQLTEIRKLDPNLNENALFVHANKFKFTNLVAAYQNLQEIKNVATETEQRVLKNIKTRDADPVSVPGGNPNADDGYDPRANSQFSSAVEFYQRMTGK